MQRPDIGLDYTVLDCPDPAVLASFYCEVLGWRIIRAEDDWYVIAGPAEQRLAFQLAPDFKPMNWPNVGVGTHIDLIVDSLDTAEEWVVDLGATRISGIPDQPSFRVYRDPAGHHFCLCLCD